MFRQVRRQVRQRVPVVRLSTRLAWVGLVLTSYVSLYPFSGWRVSGAAPFDYLFAPLPRVITGFDVASNMLAYVPLGALLLLAWRQRVNAAPLAVMLSMAVALALSLSLEALQNYLPMRVPSNLDLLANGLGALVGIALALRWGYLANAGGRLDRAWQRLRADGQAHDLGIAMLALWWLAQWSPHTPLFGIGGLRQMVGGEAPGAFSVDRFVVFEALAVGAGMLAAGLVAAALLRRHRRQFALTVLAVGVLIKIVGAWALASRGDAFAWLTPGAVRGMIGGSVLLVLCATLHPRLRRAVAACALLLATALNNLIPDNPYLLAGVPAFPAAQWLNFDGLSRIAALLWPFLTLSWLMTVRTER